MLIRVEHATYYVYSEPLDCEHAISAHDAALRPHPGGGELEGSTCPAPPPRHGRTNTAICCHTLTVAQPVTELEIRVSGLVRTRDTNGVVGRRDRRAAARPLSP